MAFNRNLVIQDYIMRTFIIHRLCRHPQPSQPPRNGTPPLLVSAAIAGLPRDHDVPIRICLALRPHQHPCPPAPAGDHDRMPAADTAPMCWPYCLISSLSCLGLMLA